MVVVYLTAVPTSLMPPNTPYRVREYASICDIYGVTNANFTLSGVMRFLQTEWHRHERDRNAWEIERQEMKGRIAALEGSARRSDATQKALKRYVAILEKKVKDQAAQLKSKAAGAAQDAGDDHSVKQPPKIDRAALIHEKLKCESRDLSSTLAVLSITVVM